MSNYFRCQKLNKLYNSFIKTDETLDIMKLMTAKHAQMRKVEAVDSFTVSLN